MYGCGLALGAGRSITPIVPGGGGQDWHHHGVPELPVVVETERGTPDELRTKQMLEELLEEHDVARFTFTNRVRIDEKATPHSHPVLTLSTRFMVRTLDCVIADYLHEQLHWYVAGRRSEARQADREWRTLYGRVPRSRKGGARTRRSTLLHLTVNWLEIESLKQVLDAERASNILDAKAVGSIYPWVYQKVRDDGERIRAVLDRTGLTALLKPA